MANVSKLWRLLPHDHGAARALAREAAVPEVVAQLLINRGMRDAGAVRGFLDRGFGRIHKPDALPNIAKAVERIVAALAARRRVCVFGDYDVDGTTGTAILVGLFQRLRLPIDFYIPDRLSEGYGLSGQALRDLAARGFGTIITVDCGISAVREAKLARELGLELIITDHHEPKDELPDADVIVHPRLAGSAYPYGYPCGAAVAFKLAWALAQRLVGAERVGDSLQAYLLDCVGLAALGTVADMVPLADENRAIVIQGLRRLNERPPVGITALRTVSSKKGVHGPLTATDIGFSIGPRINAAGRMGSARSVIDLLLTPDAEKAGEIALYLDQKNTARKELEARACAQAAEMVEACGWANDPALVLAHADWHPGVMGIVANRVAERFGKPTLLVALRPGEDIVGGSGRSVPGFPLHQALSECGNDLLPSHGGHGAACGFRVAASDIDKLRDRFREVAAAHFPEGGPPPPALTLDAEIPLSAVTRGLVDALATLEPYGQGNQQPVFLVADVEPTGVRRLGASQGTLSCVLKSGGTSLRVVGFSMGDRHDELMACRRVCVALKPTLNVWNGMTSVEAHLEDFQAGGVAKLA